MANLKLKGKIVTADLMPYCIVNKHNDLLAMFRFSETAKDACYEMNLYGKNKDEFRVEMTSNVITNFAEYKYLN